MENQLLVLVLMALCMLLWESKHRLTIKHQIMLTTTIVVVFYILNKNI